MPFVSIDRVAVGGISAGGCLAASFALFASCSDETGLTTESPLRLLPKSFRFRSQYLLYGLFCIRYGRLYHDLSYIQA